MPSKLPLLCLALSFLITPARAQETHHHAPVSTPQAADKTAVAVEDYYAAVMDKMHKDMMIAPTGDADADFVRGMIPHHQGAVDMAKVLKEKGKDPELQKLADEIIVAQEKEIAFMKAWLAKHKAK